MSVLKTMGKAELLEVDKGLYFKDRVSAKGSQSEYEMDICDFRQKPMGDACTVGELNEESKMSLFVQCWH